MAESGKYATNADRLQHQNEIDAVIGAWTSAHTSSEVLAKLKEKEFAIPSGTLGYVQSLSISSSITFCAKSTSHEQFHSV